MALELTYNGWMRLLTQGDNPFDATIGNYALCGNFTSENGTNGPIYVRMWGKWLQKCH